MSRKLRIIVADDEPRMRDYFQEILPLVGHEVLAAAKTGRELIELADELKPDLVITDIKMPDMDGIEAARDIGMQRPVPIILVSAYHDSDLIHRAENQYVFGYLVKPIKQADLEPAISIAVRRFDEFLMLRHEADDLKQALEDRKIIERAKGVIMKRTALDEAGAFHRLQKLARDKNQKVVNIARMILTAEEAMN